ncbi:hypothetical protein Hanom_Chr11g01042601 [Helianthus anomalus]
MLGVTARVTKVETRARQAEEARDGLTTSLNQVKADRDWMRDQGIGHIVGTILDAPENVAVVNELKECARRAGFKADTEGLYAAAVDAYNNLSLFAIEDIEKRLEAEDCVDRLRLLYERPEEEEEGEEEEAASGAKEDAGTSGTKEN